MEERVENGSTSFQKVGNYIYLPSHNASHPRRQKIILKMRNERNILVGGKRTS
jgi:hypothetical protein